MNSALWLSTQFSLFLFSLAPLVVSSSSVTVEPLLPHLLNASTLPPPHPHLVLSLSRRLQGAGFHRTLLTQVEQLFSLESSSSEYGSAGVEDGVGVAIVEDITCDMYIDVDQVWKKKRREGGRKGEGESERERETIFLDDDDNNYVGGLSC